MGGSRNRKLIIFTRFPEAGTTKTRLIPSLGAKGAAKLQRRMAEHTLARISKVRITPGLNIEIRYAGGGARRIQDWLGPKYIYCPQGKGDLGNRMSSAFKDAFRNGADQVTLIGTDIPGITATTIESAFNILEQADLALGPAKDGGYYLVGLRHNVFEAARGLFTGINWGGDRVLAETRAVADVAGLRTRLLEKLADVDYPEDLQVWEREISQNTDDD